MSKFGVQYHCYIHDDGVQLFISTHTWPAGLVPDLMWLWEGIDTVNIGIYRRIWISGVYINLSVVSIRASLLTLFSTYRQGATSLINEVPKGFVMNFHDIKWPYFDIRKARNHESGHGSDAPKIEGQNALPYCSKAYLVAWGWCRHPGHAYRQVMHLRRARTKQIQSWFLTEPCI
jgi:hypothetical protein